MALKLFHRVLITSGIVLGVICSLFVGYRILVHGDSSLLPTGILGGVSAVGLALYLRWFLRKRT